jgi:hypothetical protein
MNKCIHKQTYGNTISSNWMKVLSQYFVWIQYSSHNAVVVCELSFSMGYLELCTWFPMFSWGKCFPNESVESLDALTVAAETLANDEEAKTRTRTRTRVNGVRLRNGWCCALLHQLSHQSPCLWHSVLSTFQSLDNVLSFAHRMTLF